MHIAVVGSGPAGLSAAYRLQQAGHRVEVFEALSVIGGRTHAEHFGPGHHCDTGAGWLATFYTRTLALFAEVGIEDFYLRPRKVRGAADLWIDGKVVPWPFRGEAVAQSPLLTDADRARWAAYLQHLMAVQPDDLEPDLLYDGRNAEDEFTPLGSNIVEYMLRTLFEGPWFTRLNTLSAAMARLWLKPLQDTLFFQVKGGMDAPWLHLAQSLDVQTDQRVSSLQVNAQSVTLTCTSGIRTFDGVVLAVPAPAAMRILVSQPDYAPAWLSEIRYAPQVRVYAAKQSAHDAHFGVHLLPPTSLFSIEHDSGRHGAWGECPADWQWGLVCTYGATCAQFLEQDRLVMTQQLWDEARKVSPSLFPLHEADVLHSIRWEWAVPIFSPGHYRRLATHQHRPPIVFAGDWMNNACVEGAVRSGETAARAFQ